MKQLSIKKTFKLVLSLIVLRLNKHALFSCCIYNKKNESERCINQYKLLNELFPYLQDKINCYGSFNQKEGFLECTINKS